MTAQDNGSHVVGGGLRQDFSGSHQHAGLRAGLGCDLKAGEDYLGWVSGNTPSRHGEGNWVTECVREQQRVFFDICVLQPCIQEYWR